MSLHKKRPLAALDFPNRIIQRDFPLRAYVAANVGNPFMGAHSFSSINALYLHGVRHSSLLTGACASFNECFRRVHAMGDVHRRADFVDASSIQSWARRSSESSSTLFHPQRN
jgi:hypothetical protein